MINNLLLTLLKIPIKLLNTVINIIILPITVLINTLFPSVTTYVSYINSFLNDYVFNGIKFFKQVFLNLTHFPNELLTFSVLFVVALYSFYISTASIRVIKGAWLLWKGNGN